MESYCPPRTAEQSTGRLERECAAIVRICILGVTLSLNVMYQLQRPTSPHPAEPPPSHLIRRAGEWALLLVSFSSLVHFPSNLLSDHIPAFHRTFFGGSDETWATPNTTHTYFRNIGMWGSAEASTGSINNHARRNGGPDMIVVLVAMGLAVAVAWVC